MTADPWADGAARTTQVFSSADGEAWEHMTTLGFEVAELRHTSFGLVAIGVRGGAEATMWLSATSTDARHWNETKVALAPHSAIRAVLADSDQVVLAVDEIVDSELRERRTRLISSADGVRWRTIPAPPCVVTAGHFGPAGAAHGTWAMVVEPGSPKLALSVDRGATWSCSNLSGEPFDIDPRWGPPELTNVAVLRDTIALVGGRTLEPGNKANRSAAIWYLL
jgi:hypothetical protein